MLRFILDYKSREFFEETRLNTIYFEGFERYEHITPSGGLCAIYSSMYVSINDMWLRSC